MDGYIQRVVVNGSEPWCFYEISKSVCSHLFHWFIQAAKGMYPQKYNGCFSWQEYLKALNYNGEKLVVPKEIQQVFTVAWMLINTSPLTTFYQTVTDLV